MYNSQEFCMMNRLKLILLLYIGMTACGVSAQVNDKNQGIVAGYFDTDDETNNQRIDYSNFRLPPLSLLFENAKSNPSIELLAREEAIQRELCKKERRNWSTWITGSAAYSYGVMDSYGTSESVISPVIYQYMGSKQNYWNIGARANIPLSDILDMKSRAKRQRLATEKVALQKDIAYEELKQTIATLYVRITNNMISLKTAGENAAAYKGAGLLNEEEFKMGEITVRDLAETKRWESSATQEYQNLQSAITTDILVLEILTHTPIITNSTVEINYSSKK